MDVRGTPRGSKENSYPSRGGSSSSGSLPIPVYRPGSNNCCHYGALLTHPKAEPAGPGPIRYLLCAALTVKSSLLLGLSSFCSCSRKTLSKALKMVRNYVSNKITLEHRQQQKELTEKKESRDTLEKSSVGKSQGKYIFSQSLVKTRHPCVSIETVCASQVGRQSR